MWVVLTRFFIISGTGALSESSKLLLAELNIGVKCIADIRSAGITAFVEKDICQLNIFPAINELKSISLQFASARIDIFQE